MKTYKYRIVFKTGDVKVEEFNADSVLDGHYQIYRKYGRSYFKACYIK